MNLIAFTSFFPKISTVLLIAIMLNINTMALAEAKNSYVIRHSLHQHSEEEFPKLLLQTQYSSERQNSDNLIELNQAVIKVVNWHPAITEAVAKLLEQTKQIDVVSAKYYPQINAGMNNGYSNSYANADARFTPSFVFYVSQVLYDFGKIDNTLAVAKAGVAREQANVLLTIDKISHDAAAAAVQIQGYQNLVNVADEQVKSLQQIGELIRQRNAAGVSSLSDVMQTDTRIEGAQASLMQFQGALQRFKVTLASYMGNDVLPRLSNTIPQGMQSACRKPINRLGQLPAVMVAKAQALQARAQLAQSKSAMLPTVSLEPSVTHYLNDNYANNSTLNKTQYAAWLRINMPIYQGGGLTANRDAAEYTLASAKAAIKTAVLEAKQNLMTAKDESLSLQQSLQVQTRQQKLAERTLALYREQYLQLGTRPLLDLLNVAQEIYQAKFSQAQTLIQLHLFDLDCLLNTGNIRKAFALENNPIQGVEIRQ